METKKTVEERIASQGFWNGAFSGQGQSTATFNTDGRRSMGDTAARGRSFSNDFSNAATLEEKQSYARQTLYDRGQNFNAGERLSDEQNKKNAMRELYGREVNNAVQNYSQSEFDIPKAYDERQEQNFDYNSNRHVSYNYTEPYGNLNTPEPVYGNLYENAQAEKAGSIYSDYQGYSDNYFEGTDENQISLFDSGYVSTRYAEPVAPAVEVQKTYIDGPTGFGINAYNRNLVDYVEETTEEHNQKYAGMTEEYSRPTSRTMQYAENSFAREADIVKESKVQTDKSKKISKNTMLLAVYAAIVVVIGALIITTGVLISKISRDINGLENQITQQTDLLTERSGTLATLENDSVLEGKAKDLNMVKAGVIHEVEVVALADLPVYPATTNWFDKFCDWLSNLVN